MGAPAGVERVDRVHAHRRAAGEAGEAAAMDAARLAVAAEEIAEVVVADDPHCLDRKVWVEPLRSIAMS